METPFILMTDLIRGLDRFCGAFRNKTILSLNLLSLRLLSEHDLKILPKSLPRMDAESE